ncbi:hypothetical protein BSQ33_03275 [Vibrio gazogenes]|uniref:Uncharacterized protein n=1 Tax=Vibrio gazogenes TaxID=687 RepID=A0A1Z2SCD5_VIBGA|nr:hypothetical protein BSQ33_03275 [Vibrio gazogenes]
MYRIRRQYYTSAILFFFLWTRVFKDIGFSKSYSKQIKELTQYIDASSLKKNKKIAIERKDTHS